MCNRLMKEFEDMEDLSEYINEQNKEYKLMIYGLNYDERKGVYRMEYKLFIRAW